MLLGQCGRSRTHIRVGIIRSNNIGFEMKVYCTGCRSGGCRAKVAGFRLKGKRRRIEGCIVKAAYKRFVGKVAV